MQINLEKTNPLSIREYDEKTINVGGTIYQKTLLINQQKLTELPKLAHCPSKIDFADIEAYLDGELLLIGCDSTLRNNKLQWQLASRNMGLEIISIGSAARTHNILLSDDRLFTSLFIL